jgi:hypothetical protein
MIERPTPSHTPQPEQSLEAIMHGTHPGWETFSESQRGEIVVAWLNILLNSEYGNPLRQALGIEATHTEDPIPQVSFYSKPTNSVVKADLLWSSPELAERIEQEQEEILVDYVADKVGDALQEMYWDAVRIVPEDYFQVGVSSEIKDLNDTGKERETGEDKT